jgi:hypothetical protein
MGPPKVERQLIYGEFSPGGWLRLHRDRLGLEIALEPME